MDKFEVFEEENLRIDKYLSERLDCSRAYIQKLLEQNLILVNDEPVKASYKVMNGDFITLLVGLSLVCEFGAKFYFTRKWWQLLLVLFFLGGIIAYFIRYQL